MIKSPLGLVVTVTVSRMSMVASTVALSTVAVAVALPAVLPEAKVEVAVPLVNVVPVGLTVPSEPPLKVTLVPLGTLNPPTF